MRRSGLVGGRRGTTALVTDDEPLEVELARAAYWIRHYAELSGQTLNHVADFARVSRQSFYDVLKKRRNPTLRTLALISRQVGVEVRDLVQPIPEAVEAASIEGGEGVKPDEDG